MASAAVGSFSVGLQAQQVKQQDSKRATTRTRAGERPIIISANNGFNYLDEAFGLLKNGGDTLDAALKVVQGPENDPKDDSVGLGGLPYEECVV